MSEQLSSQAAGTSDMLGDIIGKVLASQALGNGEPSPAPSNEPSSAGGSGATNQFGDIFSSLLSNPDLLIKLPSIISAAKPILDIFSQAQKNTTAEKDVPAISAMNIEGGKAGHSSSREPDCRNALLCAMKPYLSSDRQRTVDYVIKLSRLGDILKTL